MPDGRISLQQYLRKSFFVAFLKDLEVLELQLLRKLFKEHFRASFNVILSLYLLQEHLASCVLQGHAYKTNISNR